MKLETDAGNTLCLFSSVEHRKADTLPTASPSSTSSDGAASCCSVGAGEGSPSAQVSPNRSIADTAGAPFSLAGAAAHREGAAARKGTSSSAAAATTSTKDSSGCGTTTNHQPHNGSNGSAENRETVEHVTKGLFGCGPRDDQGDDCLCLRPPNYCFNSLSCEHFKFIDDDDDEGEDVDATSSARVVDENRSNSTNEHSVPGPCNGNSSDIDVSDRNGTTTKINGHHDHHQQQQQQQHHMREQNGGGEQHQVEVSDSNNSSAKKIVPASPRNNCNGNVDKPITTNNNNTITTAAKHDGMCDVRPTSNGSNANTKNMSNCHHKQLRSVLKKGRSLERKRGPRVTFDEAVTLYSDDYDDPQLLALRSAAEVNYPEVFYMFEPPIEYQDLLPFEPPAEYRDPDTGVGGSPVNLTNDVVATEKVEEIVTDRTVDDSKSLPEVCDHSVALEEKNADVVADNAATEADANTLEEDANRSDGSSAEPAETAAEKRDSEPTDLVEGSENVVEEAGQRRDQPSEQNEMQEEHVEWNDHAEESERVFQRFLEAEREFAEDDELNRVFHVLENDLGCDEKDDAFDDNFFKKLIGLLTAAEGDVRVPQGEFFSTTDFTTSEDDIGRDTEEDDSSQTHSRTLSEADSDCSVSSQDTIIVRMGEDDVSGGGGGDHQNGERRHGKLCRQHSESDQSVDAVGTNYSEARNDQKKATEVSSETYDEVFNDLQHPEIGSPVEHVQSKDNAARTASTNSELISDDSARQGSSGGSVPSGVATTAATTPTTATPPRETVQDADDSTSSDSRSGEVEEEIRLDDIGYDEEDADDYDEECLRGMVRGNSKIRRIIKKNALQCTLFRSIEARRRQQAGYKPPRPKSPPLSQESLVEQLKWLTTVDDNKDIDPGPNFCPKPPDVILSTGSVPLNGNLPRCSSSESEFSSCPAAQYRHPVHYVTQPRHMMATDGKGTYLVQQPVGYPVPHPSRTPRPWLGDQRGQMAQHQQQYAGARPVMHPMPAHMPQTDERLATASPTPRDYRDWRVIQRVASSRDVCNYDPQMMAAGFRRCPNGPHNYYPRNFPPEATTKGGDELEQFVMEGTQRMERIRKRYSVAEEDDDPTFGFARRPSVRGVQSRIQYQPSDTPSEAGSKQGGPVYATVDSGAPGGRARSATLNRDMTWCRNTSWRPGDQPQGLPVYCTPGMSPSQAPIPLHRASVAMSDMPGCATLPHPKAHTDTRYHSYAENMYSGSQTLPHKRWQSADPRTYMIPGNPGPHVMGPPHPMARLPPGNGIHQQPAVQVPPHTMPGVSSDERGVPEGASSSPKMSTDSLYHGPLPEVMPIGATHKDDGMIYYSMNV